MNLPAPDASPTVDLDGRAILVTGATGGLGRALALACARSGATVVLHGRVVRRIEALYDEIVAAGGPEPTILPLDLAATTTAEFAAVADALRTQLGRLDGLIHVAATLGSLGPLQFQAFDSWPTVQRVNLTAAAALTVALRPLLLDAADPAVVFTLDSHAGDPRAYWGAYGVSKAGLAALAAICADENDQPGNPRVNAVVPGPIRSPLRMLTHPGEDKAAIPMPGAIVPLYLHLLGGDAGIRGACIDAAAWLAGRPACRALVSSRAG